MPRYQVVVYVPVLSAETLRAAMADAGVGTLGKYDYCSFSSKGTGRFRPLKGANPAIGIVGSIEAVEEERIEAMVEVHDETELRRIIDKIRAAHPYEEPAIHVLPMLSL
jgi:hypothetical protein